MSLGWSSSKQMRHVDSELRLTASTGQPLSSTRQERNQATLVLLSAQSESVLSACGLCNSDARVIVARAMRVTPTRASLAKTYLEYYRQGTGRRAVDATGARTIGQPRRPDQARGIDAAELRFLSKLASNRGRISQQPQHTLRRRGAGSESTCRTCPGFRACRYCLKLHSTGRPSGKPTSPRLGAGSMANRSSLAWKQGRRITCSL